jgi:hypothetical protein
MAENRIIQRVHRPILRLKHGTELSLNKSAIHLLGCPDYLEFLWGEDEKMLLIRSASDETALSIPIDGSYYAHKNKFRIRRRNFLQTILRYAHWGDDKVYHCTGEYIKAMDMVAFRITDATILDCEKEEVMQ